VKPAPGADYNRIRHKDDIKETQARPKVDPAILEFLIKQKGEND
jgi:hypothetical protein